MELVAGGLARFYHLYMDYGGLVGRLLHLPLLSLLAGGGAGLLKALAVTEGAVEPTMTSS